MQESSRTVLELPLERIKEHLSAIDSPEIPTRSGMQRRRAAAGNLGVGTAACCNSLSKQREGPIPLFPMCLSMSCFCVVCLFQPAMIAFSIAAQTQCDEKSNRPTYQQPTLQPTRAARTYLTVHLFTLPAASAKYQIQFLLQVVVRQCKMHRKTPHILNAKT